MKFSQAILVLALLREAAAVRLHDDDYLNLPEIKDEHDMAVDKAIEESKKSLAKASAQDQDLINQFEK